uniref:hypothetical protein n=1 Tax=Mycolicibacterium obuense TaxID=1807 RepID=UPI003F58F2AA
MTLSHNTSSNEEERQAVLSAITRIHDGRAERSNGAHTVVALATESGITRQRLYEHHSDLLNDFKATAGATSVGPNIKALQRQLAQTGERNQQLAAENALLRSKIRTLSAVITELTLDSTNVDAVVAMPRNRLRG